MTTDNKTKPTLAQLVHQHDDDERHVMDYVRVLYKRRWVAIPAFLIVFTIGAINSFRTTPIYEARAQLLIEKDTPKVGTLNTMFQERTAGTTTTSTRRSTGSCRAAASRAGRSRS